MPAMRDRFEDPETPLATGIERVRRAFVTLQRATQTLRPLIGGHLDPSGLREALPDDRAVSGRVLAYIEGREVKAESAHPSDQTAHLEIARVLALVLEQARGYDIQVIEKLLRALVMIRTSVVSGPQSLHELTHEHTVRHVMAARMRGLLRGWQNDRVALNAVEKRTRDIHAARALRKRLGERLALEEVAIDDDLLVARERLANRFRIDFGIPVHVATDPGSNANDLGYVDDSRFRSVVLEERTFDLFVEDRNDLIEDLRDEKEHVLALFRHCETLPGVLRGLPSRGDLGPHAFPDHPHLRRTRRQP